MRPPRLGDRGQGWVALQLALLVAIGVVGVLTRGGWPSSLRTPAAVVGVVLLVVGGLGAVLAVTGLGSALTALPAPLEGQRLRTSGIYAVVRHPIYGALIVLALGVALLSSPWTLVPTVALTAVLDLKRRVEEDFLSSVYADYADYRRAVRKALLPYVW
jgi:protein-S-isoprenylcysteine O-methyltransferase Ste14